MVFFYTHTYTTRTHERSFQTEAYNTHDICHIMTTTNYKLYIILFHIKGKLKVSLIQAALMARCCHLNMLITKTKRSLYCLWKKSTVIDQPLFIQYCRRYYYLGEAKFAEI